MKLYDSFRAPNPRRVRWVMAEKGIEDVEIVQVDIMSGDHKTPDYRAKVGVPHVPALELDDGTVVSESVAICRYLEALYPEPNLFGHDPREQAVVEMWTRRCEFYLANPIMLNVRLTHPALAVLEATQQPQVADYNRVSAERFMKTLDRHLAEHEFIALDRFTIADIVGAVGLDFARMVKYRPPEEFTHLARWLDACRARPAAKAGI
ncbi:glutathione S-transferase family protein [Brevundimonas subvibrioides]|jgi:glutathione S-transferase|uniref:Glutathione S-transferase domain protein n=1 Tax=Brevundimonas subvibrioides (strain ATCC 15264 / DSM 4735 / LMG 14903 / NBRC 16000 / CB 81) TaxID=633149 RepID=D9QMW9_BRESC|nr:glutathione S-transferase [Brevundimonas subvibrioides]ADL02125.1 Glutathione S-transferase domain protein [Brevundimonas subvibrioides ATCC 15264]